VLEIFKNGVDTLLSEIEDLLSELRVSEGEGFGVDGCHFELKGGLDGLEVLRRNLRVHCRPRRLALKLFEEESFGEK
jgi:hypothetical protein